MIYDNKSPNWGNEPYLLYSWDLYTLYKATLSSFITFIHKLTNKQWGVVYLEKIAKHSAGKNVHFLTIYNSPNHMHMFLVKGKWRNVEAKIWYFTDRGEGWQKGKAEKDQIRNLEQTQHVNLTVHPHLFLAVKRYLGEKNQIRVLPSTLW